jgi:diacylglycerol O-acyltransferase
MTDAVEAHVREVDAFTIRMERDPLLRSTITAVVVLDRVPSWEVLVDRIDRATRLAPTFRQRLVPSPFGAPPRWIVDDEIDLTWHVRRVGVPPPSTIESVLDMARVASTTAFDPARPLWQITLVDGLDEGRAALIVKVHHALTDGIGGIQLANHLVDLQRTPPDLGPLPPVPEGRRHDAIEGIADAIGFGASRGVSALSTIVRGMPAAAEHAARHPRATGAAVAATATSLGRLVRPMRTTLSPVMTERRIGRHFERLDVPIDGLRAAGHAVDGTLNDALMAAIAGGVRRYHEHHGVSVDRLRVTLPISLRGDADPIGGNRLTLARAEVPVGIVDPVERMRAIGEVVRALRDEPSTGYVELVAGAMNLLPASVTGNMLKHVDFVVANVPGFGDAVYVAGAEVEAFYPFAPAIGAAVNVAMISYRGVGNIGVTTDAGAVPDPHVFLRCLGDGFDEVLAVG